MQKIEITYMQMIMIGMGVGLVLGLIPLVLGYLKGKAKLGAWGFIASILAGAAWSLLSLATVIVFIWLILRKPKAAAENGAAALEKNPSDD